MWACFLFSENLANISSGRSLNVFNDSSYRVFFWRAVFVISSVHPSKLNTKYELKMFVIIQVWTWNVCDIWDFVIFLSLRYATDWLRLCLSRNNKTSIKPCNPRIFIIVTSWGWQGHGRQTRQTEREREVSKFIKLPTIGIQWTRKVTGGQRGNTQGRAPR